MAGVAVLVGGAAELLYRMYKLLFGSVVGWTMPRCLETVGGF